MDVLIEIFKTYGFFLFLMILGYGFGKRAESNHYKSIAQREETFRKLPTCNWKKPLPMKGKLQKVELVTGSVVISIDYFKMFLASLRNFFGGRVTSYETLIDRARREAVLRMKEQCPGASQIINLRIETSAVSKNDKSGTVGSVEVLAFATALFLK